MATRPEIARAKARVALAESSGRILPDRVYALARLDLKDADREEKD